MAEKDAVKWHAWRERLRRFRACEWTVAEFCRRENVSTAVFYQWRSKLAGQLSGTASGSVDNPAMKALPKFVEVQVSHRGVKSKTPQTGQPHVEERVEIRLPNGTCVLIAAREIEALRAAIAAAGEFGMRETAGGRAC